MQFKLKKIRSDASFREFFRLHKGKKTSIIVVAKKERFKNLIVYSAINRFLRKKGIYTPKLISQHFKEGIMEIEDFGNNTIIKGKNGEIHIKNTFLGIEEIKIVLTNENYTIQKKINKNIYSEEIENISQNILDGAIKPTYPAMQLKETCINMKILESWRNA